jgi:hypothetical protein
MKQHQSALSRLQGLVKKEEEKKTNSLSLTSRFLYQTNQLFPPSNSKNLLFHLLPHRHLQHKLLLKTIFFFTFLFIRFVSGSSSSLSCIVCTK